MEQKKFVPIRCRLRHPETFDKSYSYKPINLEDGVIALVGLQKGQDNLKVQTILFNTNPENGDVWSLRKAKEWIKINKSSLKTKVILNDIVKNIRKPAPKLLAGDKLIKAVEKLNYHFKESNKKLQKQGR